MYVAGNSCRRITDLLITISEKKEKKKDGHSHAQV
jgi:hypothetical protein